MVDVAKTKLLRCQKKRMEVEDERMAQLRMDLSCTYIDSDDESESVWPLAPQQMDRVTMAINRGSEGECLSERYRIRVTRGDLRTLTRTVWLNDEVGRFPLMITIHDSCGRFSRLSISTSTWSVNIVGNEEASKCISSIRSFTQNCLIQDIVVFVGGPKRFVLQL